MQNILDRINQLSLKEMITITSLEREIGASKGVLSRAIKNQTDIQAKWLTKIVENYPRYNPEWLLTGKGEMLKSNERNLKEDRNLIPLFEDVQTIGGTAVAANVDPSQHVSEWIDAGDWFPGATAAIRHYGDSMIEYPSGCILALKEVVDRELIAWSKIHCLETSEYRVTKIIYDDEDFIKAYSTNLEAFPDGQLIHAPFKIPKKSITKIYQVLGYVVKEYSNGPVPVYIPNI